MQTNKNSSLNFYEGDLNTTRIKTYKKIAERYYVEENVVRDIFCAGIDFALEKIKNENKINKSEKIRSKNEINVIKTWGKTHTIEKRIGTKVDLRKLKKDERICFGDGKTFHWLLTKKK